LDKTYPAAVPTRIVAITVRRDINRLLKRYLLTGMPDWVTVLKRALKLSQVGFLTKILGGKANSSFGGLKAFMKMKIIGSDMKRARGMRIA